MNQIPSIGKVMTEMPLTIGKEAPLHVALDLMQSKRIRHLPVHDGGKLVGILSDRDIRSAISFKGPHEMTVGDVMTADPYSVTPDTPLDLVAETMAQNKYGSAIIQNTEGKVVGIFTAVDGLRVLCRSLREAGK